MLCKRVGVLPLRIAKESRNSSGLNSKWVPSVGQTDSQPEHLKSNLQEMTIFNALKTGSLNSEYQFAFVLLAHFYFSSHLLNLHNRSPSLAYYHFSMR